MTMLVKLKVIKQERGTLIRLLQNYVFGQYFSEIIYKWRISNCSAFVKITATTVSFFLKDCVHHMHSEFYKF